MNIGPKRAFCFPLHFQAGMYVMADKFNLQNLKKLAGNKFRIRLQYFEVVKRSPVDPTLTRILEVIQLIYNTTPGNDRGLRDLVVEYVAQHWSAFLALEQFSTFMAANTEFIVEIIEAKGLLCSRCRKDARETRVSLFKTSS